MQNSLCCIIPARNESGHLIQVLDHVLSVPLIGEVIIVEGGSNDDTWEVALKIASSNSKKVKAFQQRGKGKFNAVMEGALKSQSDLILIWDADGTVPVEDTIKIIESGIRTGNPTMGNRLRGSMEKGAMQPANWLGNWAFAIVWAPLLKAAPKDMLCGTKLFPKVIFSEMPKWLIHADPYGDFALVGHARMRNLKIDSITVDYKARTYGATNIRRWSGGVKLLAATIRIYSRIIPMALKGKLK